MGAVIKLLSCSDRIISSFFLRILPEMLRVFVLSIFFLYKYNKTMSSSLRYMSMINKRSSNFVHKDTELELEQCSICLSRFEAGGLLIVDMYFIGVVSKNGWGVKERALCAEVWWCLRRLWKSIS